MQLFGTDLLKTYWAHDVEMTSMRRRYVASTSLRRHVPAGSLAPPCPPPFVKPGIYRITLWYGNLNSRTLICKENYIHYLFDAHGAFCYAMSFAGFPTYSSI